MYPLNTKEIYRELRGYAGMQWAKGRDAVSVGAENEGFVHEEAEGVDRRGEHKKDKGGQGDVVFSRYRRERRILPWWGGGSSCSW